MGTDRRARQGARRQTRRVAIRFEDESWTWAEYVDAVRDARRVPADAARAGRAAARRGAARQHARVRAVARAAAALVDAVVVGINPTRRGAELARDITHADCQLIVTESRHVHLLDGLDLGPRDRPRARRRHRRVHAPRSRRYAGAALPDVDIDELGIYLLLFTSGTSGAPKACICSQGRLARMSAGLHPDAADHPRRRPVPGHAAVPLELRHDRLRAVARSCGATAALRRRFSASGFLPDVRKFGVDVLQLRRASPLSYILATPEQPDDADTTLTKVFGNEGADLDIERFATALRLHGAGRLRLDRGRRRRSTRVPGMPKGSLGARPRGNGRSSTPRRGEECPPAEFDEQGRLLNPLEAIGEIVNKNGAAGFEGYYKNDEANAGARARWLLLDRGPRLPRRATAGSTSRAATSSGCASTARTSPPRRSSGSSPATPTSCSPRSTRCPTRRSATRSWSAFELRPGATFDPDDFDEFLVGAARPGHEVVAALRAGPREACRSPRARS